MTEQEWIQKLKEEGFDNISTIVNGPNSSFEEFTHSEQTSHIVLDGQFTLISGNMEVVMNPGERFEIPPNTSYKGLCGATGCKFIVATK